MSAFRRLKNSFIGMLIGLVLVPASVALHVWNEYRTIHRTQGLIEAAEVLQPISKLDVVETKLNDRLVYLTGTAATSETLRDEVFGVNENAVRLVRDVEMFQWDRTSEKSSGNNRRTYVYRSGWHQGRIDSSNFDGHNNPSLQFEKLDSIAREVNVGAYRLNDRQKRDLDDWRTIVPDQAVLTETVGLEQADNLLVANEMVYWSNTQPNPESPQIGDVRMTFRFVPPGDVSLVAKLAGNTFDEFRTSNGESIEQLYCGTLSATEVVGRMKSENTTMAWALRFIGLIACAAGFSMILGPLQAMVSWIPLLGDLTGFLLFVAAALMAVIVSSTTIAIAWIAVRPVLGISLLALSAAAGYAIVCLRRKKDAGQPLVLEPIG